MDEVEEQLVARWTVQVYLLKVVGKPLFCHACRVRLEDLQHFVKAGVGGVQAIRLGRFGVHRLTRQTHPMISASSLISGTAFREERREGGQWGQWVIHAEVWKIKGLIQKAQRDHHPLLRNHYPLFSPRVSEGNIRVLKPEAKTTTHFERKGGMGALLGAKELEMMWK